MEASAGKSRYDVASTESKLRKKDKKRRRKDK